MRITEQKLGFKTARIILDDPDARAIISEPGFSRIIIISHTALRLAGFRCKEKKTGLIELNSSLEAVFASFRKTTRNEISRTFRDPSLIFEIRPVSEEAYELYLSFERTLKRAPFPLQHFERCIEFAALYKGKIESAIWVYPSEPVVRIRSIFSSRKSSDPENGKRIGYETRRLVYEICRWGIEHERIAIDVAAVDPQATINRGIAAFKMSFNPRIISEYTYTFATPLYRFLEKIRYAMR